MSATNPFRNFDQYKIDPLTEIRNAGIITNGDVYWVSSTSDAQHRQRTNDLGNTVVRISLQDAINKMKANNNDYALVLPTDNGTVRTLGTAVDVNKNQIHILGVGMKPGPLTYGGLTFNGFVVATGNDTELVMVTGADVEMGGMRFLGTSGTHASGTITATFRAGTAASGTPHDLWLHDMTIENNQAAAAGGTAPVFEVVGDGGNGISGLRVDRCTIGNAFWAPTPGMNLVGGTAGPSRMEFTDCTFLMDAQATTDRFVTLGTGQIDYAKFRNCDFINVESGTLPASALTGAVLVDNVVLMKGNSYVNTTQAGTDTEVFKTPASSGTQAAIFDLGIAIGSAALTPA